MASTIEDYEAAIAAGETYRKAVRELFLDWETKETILTDLNFGLSVVEGTRNRLERQRIRAEAAASVARHLTIAPAARHLNVIPGGAA